MTVPRFSGLGKRKHLWKYFTLVWMNMKFSHTNQHEHYIEGVTADIQKRMPTLKKINEYILLSVAVYAKSDRKQRRRPNAWDRFSTELHEFFILRLQSLPVMPHNSWTTGFPDCSSGQTRSRGSKSHHTTWCQPLWRDIKVPGPGQEIHMEPDAHRHFWYWIILTTATSWHSSIPGVLQLQGQKFLTWVTATKALGWDQATRVYRWSCLDARKQFYKWLSVMPIYS